MGLQLSGSVQLEGNLLVTGSANSVFENISVTNRITANEINVQFVSSSIIYSSGSNRFGDEAGDVHQFTGSVDVSGSINIISHGANGVVLNQDPSNAGVSSRLFFMNSLPSGMVIMNESGRMSFRSGSIPNGASGTEVMSIQHNNLNLSSGNLVVASGQGIDFSATSNGSGTTSSELLNDYEEGTFTPTLAFGGASVGITYTTQSAKYTKVGNKVSFSISLAITNKGSSTGAVTIVGLPFAVSSTTNADFIPITIGAFSEITFSTVPACIAIQGTNTLVLDEFISGGAQTALTNADFENNSTIRVAGFYFV